MSIPSPSHPSMFSGAEHNFFTDSTFIIQSERKDAFDRLEKAASPSAFHSYVERPQPGKCYPNTRVNLLHGLEQWTKGMQLPIELYKAGLSGSAGTDWGGDSSEEDVGSLDGESASLVGEVASVDWEGSSYARSDGGVVGSDDGVAGSDEELLSLGASSYEREEDCGEDAPDLSSEFVSANEEAHRRNRPIIWLNGGAGAGKSAVAQTFAERCEDMRYIVTSFFFFRTDETRNTANRLVASLAYQIAREDRSARTHIEAVVHQDPRVFDRDLQTQFLSLVIQPIVKAMQTPTHGIEQGRRPCVVIIDGLDECTGGDMQASIVRAIRDSLRGAGAGGQQNLPRFLICSRPEEPIKQIFALPDLEDMHSAINLSKDTHANRDISTFLLAQFAEIKESHARMGRANLFPEVWPSTGDLDLLLYNSSGHFIYAKTAMQFIARSIRPVHALEVVLGLRASPQRVREPFAELDTLYHHILSRAEEETNIELVRIVFGLLAVDKSPAAECHPDSLATFLNTFENGEMDIILNTTSSLVEISFNPLKAQDQLRFYHTSFVDFLRDTTRAGRFYISPESVKARTWAQCCSILDDANFLFKDALILVDNLAIFSMKEYDFYDEAKCYSVQGLEQRKKMLEFLKFSCDPNIFEVKEVEKSWVARSLVYYTSLLQKLGGVEIDKGLVHQATGHMISMLREVIYLRSNSTNIALWMTRPPFKHFSRWLSWQEYSRRLQGVLEVFPLFPLASDTPADLFSAALKCLEDERMDEGRLDGKRFADACLHHTTDLLKSFFFCPSRHIIVLNNQRCLIMNSSARRRNAPFQWRKTKHHVRPNLTRGRSHFLFWQQKYQIGNSEWFQLASRHELVFGAHPGIRSSVERPVFDLSPHPNGSVNGVLFRGKNVRMSVDRRMHILPRRRRAVLRLLEDESLPRIFDDEPIVKTRRIREGFFPTNIVGVPYSEDQYERHSRSLHLREQEQTRRELFAHILAALPAMLAKSGKLDALAAMRFKGFPPLARRFPKLTKRARDALQAYAVRHGYPALDGAFGRPSDNRRVRRARDWTSAALSAARTSLPMIRARGRDFSRQMLALLGGLDEIYILDAR